MNNGLHLTRDQKPGSGSDAGKTDHVRNDDSNNQSWSGKPIDFSKFVEKNHDNKAATLVLPHL